MSDDDLDSPITPEDIAQWREVFGESLTCYSCGEPITVGAWITMRPNTAYSWCAECLKPQ